MNENVVSEMAQFALKRMHNLYGVTLIPGAK